MNGKFFNDQNGKSYYFNTIQTFLKDNPSEILGVLTKIGAKYGFDTTVEQSQAWQNQIFELQKKLLIAGVSGDIIFEYDIVRLGKRIDVVLLIKHMVFSLEFKNGATKYLARDAEQAEDYALNLKNFHRESENLYVCPILVATDAPNDGPKGKNVIDCYEDKQVFLQYANKNTMMECITNVYNRYGDDKKIDFYSWYNSPYCPTPTIIEAAVTAYKDHTVKNIANSEAGQEGIDACEAEVSRIVKYAQENGKKCICFVTGVPGAGKTLVGLDLASKNLSVDKKIDSVYLSGNGPLVAVLRKALIDNTKLRFKEKNKTISKRESGEIQSAIYKFIQDAYGFRKDSILNEGNEPSENIIIFDEAQRCWDANHLSNWTKKKMGRELDVSEPEYFISVMNRRRDWAVIICLVGLGQDIYDGEVGINEWFRSAICSFKDWEVFYSSKIFEQLEEKSIDKEMIISCERTHQSENLHLATSVRSFRSEKQSEFVDNLLANKPKKTKQIYSEIKKDYPIYITRDFNEAKKYIRNKVRGSQRCGVIACSSAQRLKPEGIFVPTDINVEKWFLAPKEDLRSSNAMEVVASEFKVQGLEIDYSIVCWDADLRRKKSEWDYYNFKGTNWLKRKKEAQKRYLINAYRVLLTRARQSMIIFVPYGEDSKIDPTRSHEFYDDIFNYLHIDCGIDELK